MRIFYVLNLLLLTAACSQSVDAPTKTGETYIKYKVNGISTIINSKDSLHFFKRLQTAVTLHTTHSFEGFGTNNNYISMVMVTDTVIAGQTYKAGNDGTYVYRGTEIISNGKSYFPYKETPSTFISITFSRISNTSVDGTFKGFLLFDPYPGQVYKNYDTAIVTEGEFKNVQIIY